MSPRLAEYSEAAGNDVVQQLRKIAQPLQGKKVVHVNSTRIGGGVAEILSWMSPLMQELGLRADWKVIDGTPEFFDVTKKFHNGLQGNTVPISARHYELYEAICAQNARVLQESLGDADFVFIHDPQPAALIRHFPDRRGRWVWRCHIDVSAPFRPIWKYLRSAVSGYDASIFSLAAFAQPLPHMQCLVAPSIDPISEKNRAMSDEDVQAAIAPFDLDPDRPVVLQVSRFDRFKDPVGVVKAYRMARAHVPIQLVLAGGTADDDPEGAGVLEEVREEAGDDPDIHILILPPDAHRAINALQRRADIVVQKSLREGFGLTVTEALWKGKPVIGGETGGIQLQVINDHTGFRVRTPEGAAFRIRYLLGRPDMCAAMGERGKQLVAENFLLTRQLREYLTLMLVLQGSARAEPRPV